MRTPARTGKPLLVKPPTKRANHSSDHSTLRCIHGFVLGVGGTDINLHSGGRLEQVRRSVVRVELCFELLERSSARNSSSVIQVIHRSEESQGGRYYDYGHERIFYDRRFG
jgi:hypothetical protein